jgi:hypothetical protein
VNLWYQERLHPHNANERDQSDNPDNEWNVRHEQRYVLLQRLPHIGGHHKDVEVDEAHEETRYAE